ncbi:MAG: hypothetical protein LBG86_00645 [Puniceicoccales bacterium]|jgi:hypothetical protein|nr:hypothetical protein [Puniceicoccales bacterium]
MSVSSTGSQGLTHIPDVAGSLEVKERKENGILYYDVKNMLGDEEVKKACLSALQTAYRNGEKIEGISSISDAYQQVLNGGKNPFQHNDDFKARLVSVNGHCSFAFPKEGGDCYQVYVSARDISQILLMENSPLMENSSGGQKYSMQIPPRTAIYINFTKEGEANITFKRISDKNEEKSVTFEIEYMKIDGKDHKFVIIPNKPKENAEEAPEDSGDQKVDLSNQSNQDDQEIYNNPLSNILDSLKLVEKQLWDGVGLEKKGSTIPFSDDEDSFDITSSKKTGIIDRVKDFFKGMGNGMRNGMGDSIKKPLLSEDVDK